MSMFATPWGLINNGGGGGGGGDVPDASLLTKGIVRLSNDTTSNNQSLAATPLAVKTAYDNAIAYVDDRIKKSSTQPTDTSVIWEDTSSTREAEEGE